MTPASIIPLIEKAVKPTTGEAFGILNPWGQFWTYNTFETEDAARKHIEAFWRLPGFKPEHRDPKHLAKYKVVRVQVTVEIVPEPILQARLREEGKT